MALRITVVQKTHSFIIPEPIMNDKDREGATAIREPLQTDAFQVLGRGRGARSEKSTPSPEVGEGGAFEKSWR
jgi:hypothetical protein